MINAWVIDCSRETMHKVRGIIHVSKTKREYIEFESSHYRIGYPHGKPKMYRREIGKTAFLTELAAQRMLIGRAQRQLDKYGNYVEKFLPNLNKTLHDTAEGTPKVWYNKRNPYQRRK